MKTPHSPRALRLGRGRLRTPVVRAAIFVFVLVGCASRGDRLHAESQRRPHERAAGGDRARERCSGRRIRVRSGALRSAGPGRRARDVARPPACNRRERPRRDRAHRRRPSRADPGARRYDRQALAGATDHVDGDDRTGRPGARARDARAAARQGPSRPSIRRARRRCRRTPRSSSSANGRVVAGGPVGSPAVIRDGRVVFGPTRVHREGRSARRRRGERPRDRAGLRRRGPRGSRTAGGC